MAFRLDWLELVCPYCLGELDDREADDPEIDRILACRKCSRTFPVVLGIPDLRIFPDPYITAEGDHIKGRMLATRFDRLTFVEMVRMYYHITPETPPKDVELNIVRLSNAEGRARGTLDAWDAQFGRVEGETLLEVGCGTGPLLLAARERFAKQVGVDVSFRWLVMAKRRLADAGVSMPLVAACGEALPFRDGTFDVTVMDSYLEITRDQDLAVQQAHRVLRSGGRLLVSTPNRFSLGPDPHVGVPAGGLLPSGLVNAIAKQRMARPPLRRLLSGPQLGRLLARPGGTAAVSLPPLSAAQLQSVGSLGRMVGGWYNRLRRVPVAREVLFIVGPMLLGQARKA
jgi:SAM-dependent methyltransferase